MTMLDLSGRGLFLYAAGAAGAFAAEGAHAAHAEPSVADLLLPFVNFSIFAVLLAYFAWPAIRSALAERRKLVEKELSEADRARREAEAMLAEIEARRSRLREEGERLVRELRAEAEHERKRLLEAARQTALRISADARLFGEQEAARAAKTIRAEVAREVVSRVTKLVRERLTSGDEERFATEFVDSVEGGQMR